MNDRFLRACRREPVDATPVWFMRQAGRYMSSYRALRERHSLLEICRQPDLATEVTLQPVDAIDVLSSKNSAIMSTAAADIYGRYTMLYQLLVEPCPQRLVHDSGVCITDLTEVDSDAPLGRNALRFGPQGLFELK